MAKFLPSELISEIRNKQGATVFSRNRGGAVTRAWVKPAQPPSTFRAAQQAAVRTFMQRWGAVLTEAQRVAWIRSGAQTGRVDVLAQQYTLPGACHFLSVNLALNTMGYAGVDVPPMETYAHDPGAVSLVADSESQMVKITAANAPGAGEEVLIRATDAVSPGRHYISQFLRVLPNQHFTHPTIVFDVSAEWIARFGPVPQDRRIGVTVQYFNFSTGALGPVQSTDAIAYPQEVDVMLQRKLTMSSAQLLNLAAVPFELVPAQGTGLVIVPVALYFQVNFNTTAYAAGSDLIVALGTDITNLGFLKILQSQVQVVAKYSMISRGALFNTNAEIYAGTANKPLWLNLSGAAFTTGDSPVSITTFYCVASGL